MSAKEDVRRAAHELSARGHPLFSPAQLIEEARLAGSRYDASTLRPQVVYWMCANSPVNRGTGKGEFVRVARALYKIRKSEVTADGNLLRASEGALPPRLTHATSQPAAIVDISLDSSPLVAPDPTDWYWEGHVQSLVVSYLAQSGWSIKRVADTAGGEHGHDIDAHREGEQALIEVKGYPTTMYARGVRQGTARPGGSLGAQARTYFSNAILSGCLMRSENAEASVVLAFPDVGTYRNLAGRVGKVLRAAGIDIWLVSEDGSVQDVAATASQMQTLMPPSQGPTMSTKHMSSRENHVTRYGPLTRYLATRAETSFVLTFAELSQIVDLPASAKKHSAWWANSRTAHSHSASWLDAGFNARPDFNTGTVQFERGPDRGSR